MYCTNVGMVAAHRPDACINTQAWCRSPVGVIHSSSSSNYNRGIVFGSTLTIFSPPFPVHRHNKRLLQHRHEVAILAEKLMSKRTNGSLPPVRTSKSVH